MAFADLVNLLMGSDLNTTIVNIVAFFAIITFIGLLFLFIAELCGVNRR